MVESTTEVSVLKSFAGAFRYNTFAFESWVWGQRTCGAAWRHSGTSASK